jgi:hypothetical protein
MNTCANSVPLERAWPPMNFIYAKTRNSLFLETVDMLQLIYTSHRILRKLHDKEPTNEELLAIEDKIMDER